MFYLFGNIVFSHEWRHRFDGVLKDSLRVPVNWWRYFTVMSNEQENCNKVSPCRRWQENKERSTGGRIIGSCSSLSSSSSVCPLGSRQEKQVKRTLRPYNLRLLYKWCCCCGCVLAPLSWRLHMQCMVSMNRCMKEGRPLSRYHWRLQELQTPEYKDTRVRITVCK